MLTFKITEFAGVKKLMSSYILGKVCNDRVLFWIKKIH